MEIAILIWPAAIGLFLFVAVRNIIGNLNPPDPNEINFEEKNAFGKLKYLKCKQCENGVMVSRRMAKHSQLTALFLLILGFFLMFFFPIIGIPLFIIGLIFGCGSKKYWVCRSCGSKVEKN